MSAPPEVAVVDTGSGNLRSVEKALTVAGARAFVTADADAIASADKIVVPGQCHVPLEEILRHYETRQPLLKKIILPYSLRHRAMQSLYRMNITNATLFPDLDGLARSIAYELEVLWETASDPARTPS